MNDMNVLILLAIVALTILMFFGMRTMQEDHLFAIAHRAEFCTWVILALCIGSMEWNEMSSAGQHYHTLISDSHASTLILQLIVLVIITSRILAVAAFTLGNSPKVSVVVTATNTNSSHIGLAPVTNTPGTALDSDGQHTHVVL